MLVVLGTGALVTSGEDSLTSTQVSQGWEPLGQLDQHSQRRVSEHPCPVPTGAQGALSPRLVLAGVGGLSCSHPLQRQASVGHRIGLRESRGQEEGLGTVCVAVSWGHLLGVLPLPLAQAHWGVKSEGHMAFQHPYLSWLRAHKRRLTLFSKITSRLGASTAHQTSFLRTGGAVHPLLTSCWVLQAGLTAIQRRAGRGWDGGPAASLAAGVWKFKFLQLAARVGWPRATGPLRTSACDRPQAMRPFGTRM